MNRQEALREAAATLSARQVADPRPEAELLLAHALAVSRAELYASPDEPLTPSQSDAYHRLVERRAAGEPYPYITGRREFFGLDFEVNPHVLIPRPETELLVEMAVELARNKYRGQPLAVADAGTGSGAIAVSLAKSLPNAEIYATDISGEALDVASRNAEKHGVEDRITFLRGDLLAPLPEAVDLVVANLPYVTAKDYRSLQREIREHEPESALLGGEEGLDYIYRLLDQSPERIRPRASIILEIGSEQSSKVIARARSVFPGAKIEVLKDLAGMDRAVLVDLQNLANVIGE